jgi:hypothetical protein
MAADVETRRGRCATHGVVEATRDIPPIRFPFVVYAVRRYRARRAPFRCPECGSEVTVG